MERKELEQRLHVALKVVADVVVPRAIELRQLHGSAGTLAHAQQPLHTITQVRTATLVGFFVAGRISMATSVCASCVLGRVSTARRRRDCREQ